MMRKLFFAMFFAAGFVSFAAVTSVNAQTVVGKYYTDTKIDDGRNDFRLLFDLREKGVAVYSNEQNGEQTQSRKGTWTHNKRTNRITVTLPPVRENPMMGQEVKLTFVFKVEGERLKLISSKPYNDGVNEIYKRLEK